MKNKLSSLIYAIFLILVVVLFTNRFDNDGWFLLNSGRYVEQFGIPHVEPFTIHQNFHLSCINGSLTLGCGNCTNWVV